MYGPSPCAAFRSRTWALSRLPLGGACGFEKAEDALQRVRYNSALRLVESWEGSHGFPLWYSQLLQAAEAAELAGKLPSTSDGSA